MKTVLNWTEGMQFQATSGENKTLMDAQAPIGRGTAMTPKELVAAGLAGCTGMDVVAYLRKHKQPYESLQIEVDIETTKGRTPSIFLNALLTFRMTGSVDKNIYLDSVRLSQTKYCGVSEMLLKAFPIKYVVVLNNETVGEGHSEFAAT